MRLSRSQQILGFVSDRDVSLWRLPRLPSYCRCVRVTCRSAGLLRRSGSRKDSFFTKYGLAAELKYILSATGTQALFSGSIDIVIPPRRSLWPAWAVSAQLL